MNRSSLDLGAREERKRPAQGRAFSPIGGFVGGVVYPLINLGIIMWWCGQIDLGFW